MRTRQVLTSFVAGIAAVASVGSVHAHAATVITTNAVKVALELRDQIDGLNEVTVTVTCAPVNIQPPTDTELIRLIPDVSSGTLTFPGFTATTICAIAVAVDSTPAVGGLAIWVNGNVVGGPVASQQLTVTGVVPGAAPQVRIILSKAALSSSVPTAASSSTSSVPAASATSTSATSLVIPAADNSAGGTIPVASTSSSTIAAAPTSAQTASTATAGGAVVAHVLDRTAQAAVLKVVRPTTTTTVKKTLRKAVTTTTVKKAVRKTVTKPAPKVVIRTVPTTTVKAAKKS